MFQFIDYLNDEIAEMSTYEKRMANGGKEVCQMHKKLSDYRIMDQDNLNDFVELLNLISAQPYMSKCEDFLLFIEHCMPTDKCKTERLFREYQSL